MFPKCLMDYACWIFCPYDIFIFRDRIYNQILCFIYLHFSFHFSVIYNHIIAIHTCRIGQMLQCGRDIQNKSCGSIEWKQSHASLAITMPIKHFILRFTIYCTIHHVGIISLSPLGWVMFIVILWKCVTQVQTHGFQISINEDIFKFIPISRCALSISTSSDFTIYIYKWIAEMYVPP